MWLEAFDGVAMAAVVATYPTSRGLPVRQDDARQVLIFKRHEDTRWVLVINTATHYIYCSLAPTHSMPGILQRALQLFGGANATIAAQVFSFMRARFMGWGLGLAEELEAQLDTLAIRYTSKCFPSTFANFFREIETIAELLGARHGNRPTFGQLVLLFARAMVFHFAARAVEQQVCDVVTTLFPSD
jgi:hypothetical protein